MKKFMTDIKTLAALLMAGAAFTACSSSDDSIIDEQPVNPAQKTYTLTVNASKGDGAQTRALDLTGKTLTASWATTENVYVKKGETWATGSLQPQADGATATLKGELSGINIEPNNVLTLQFPRSGAISYAGQQGTIADIQANFDWATATVEVESVSPSGNINPKTATTTFTNQQAIVKFTLKDKANDAAISPSALTVTDGTSTVELTSILGPTYTANGAGVLYVAFPAAGSAKTITLTATVGDDTYTYETATAKAFVNGQYYEITVKMTKQAPAGPTYPVALKAVTTSDYVGSVITSDGYVYAKASDATADNKTAVAIIAYVGSAGSVDESSGSDNYKGLAIAMSDAAQDIHWSKVGYGIYVSCSDDLDTAIGYKNGIACTNTLSNDDGHTAASAAASNNSTDAPTGTSGWFLPSMGQWNLILQGLATKKEGNAVTANIGYGDDDTFYTYTANNLNSVITAAGGTGFGEYYDYWSSTQYDEDDAWSVQLGEGSAWEWSFDEVCCVRSALAF